MSFDQIIADLLEATQASRTTLRLERPGEVFPVVAEALAPGVKSIKGAEIPSLAAAPTVRFLADRLEILVQDQFDDSALAPPPDLRSRYGVTAQMLAPVIGQGRLVGIVSVHENRGPRAWTDAEVEMLRGAARSIHEELRRREAGDLD